MKHSGTIKLYNRYEELIKQVPYSNTTYRRNVLARWLTIKNRFGYYHICPYPERKISEVIPDAPKPAIKRPEAKYDNNKSLYP